MICKVIDTIEKYGLLYSVKSVAVGVSGGADSMCLLHILSSLKEKYGIILKAVHINHNLRGDEALRDEKLVRDYCNKNSIELTVFSKDISALSKEMNIGEEECGRIVRYECFKKAECDAVAVAHSLSDSIETTLYNLLRGTGSKGLCGIPVKREPNIIRPLIECTRAEIEKFCEIEAIPYITDSTNLTDDYKRNYIRHNIIPSFEGVNSAFENNILHTVSILREENDYIEKCAEDLIVKSKTDKGYILSDFLSSHISVRKRALSVLLSQKMTKPPEFKHIESVNNIIEKQKGKTEVSKNLYVLINDGCLSFIEKEDSIEFWSVNVKDEITETNYGVYRIFPVEVIGNGKDVFDYGKIKGELVISSRKSGDVFSFKKRGISKSIKKLFNEKKIPVSERNKIAVLRDGENIVWVEGIGVNRDYLPEEKTNMLYEIKKEG